MDSVLSMLLLSTRWERDGDALSVPAVAAVGGAVVVDLEDRFNEPRDVGCSLSVSASVGGWLPSLFLAVEEGWELRVEPERPSLSSVFIIYFRSDMAIRDVEMEDTTQNRNLHAQPCLFR